MSIVTVREAKQNLVSLLEQAMQEGEAKIRREDGQIFVIKPEHEQASPLDVMGVDLGLSTIEIIQFIQEGRRFFQQEPARYNIPDKGSPTPSEEP